MIMSMKQREIEIEPTEEKIELVSATVFTIDSIP